MGADHLIIPDEALPYLVAQRGFLDELKSERTAWERAYRESLARDMADLAGVAPPTCVGVLDVGGGLGGIDVLLARHYGPKLKVTLLDGEACAARVVRHSEPFSHADVARRFLAANGVDCLHYVDPGLRTTPDMGLEPFDLVVSFQAWGFHFAPRVYLNFVAAWTRPSAVLVLDVRRARPDWDEQLAADFRQLPLIRSAPKYERRAYVRR